MRSTTESTGIPSEQYLPEKLQGCKSLDAGGKAGNEEKKKADHESRRRPGEEQEPVRRHSGKRKD